MDFKIYSKMEHGRRILQHVATKSITGGKYETIKI
jgi:hypothetical protein